MQSTPSHRISLKKLKLSHCTPRRRLGESRYSSYSFSTLALDGSEWSASRQCCALAPGKGPAVTIARWVCPRAGVDTEARRKILSPLPGIEPRSPGRPARSQTLYVLIELPGSHISLRSDLHYPSTYASIFPVV
jgi:hypothetical protein